MALLSRKLPRRKSLPIGCPGKEMWSKLGPALRGDSRAGWRRMRTHIAAKGENCEARLALRASGREVPLRLLLHRGSGAVLLLPARYICTFACCGRSSHRSSVLTRFHLAATPRSGHWSTQQICLPMHSRRFGSSRRIASCLRQTRSMPMVGQGSQSQTFTNVRLPEGFLPSAVYEGQLCCARRWNFSYSN